MNYIIRNAQPSDAEKVVKINLDMWHKTYANILDAKVLEERTKGLDKKVEITKNSFVEDNSLSFVVEVDGIVVGQAMGRCKNDLDCDENIPQLNAMYILTEYQGIGASLDLAKAVVKKFIELGYKNMVTGCLVGNKYNQMHVALGGKLIKQIKLPQLGDAVENVYFYESLKDILSLTITQAGKNLRNNSK